MSSITREMIACAQPFDIKNIAEWSKKEGSMEKFKRFKILFEKSRKNVKK